MITIIVNKEKQDFPFHKRIRLDSSTFVFGRELFSTSWKFNMEENFSPTHENSEKWSKAQVHTLEKISLTVKHFCRASHPVSFKRSWMKEKWN